ncbi:hypothetical protein D3C80_1588410 [compost metagenome]
MPSALTHSALRLSAFSSVDAFGLKSHDVMALPLHRSVMVSVTPSLKSSYSLPRVSGCPSGVSSAFTASPSSPGKPVTITLTGKGMCHRTPPLAAVGLPSDAWAVPSRRYAPKADSSRSFAKEARHLAAVVSVLLIVYWKGEPGSWPAL